MIAAVVERLQGAGWLRRVETLAELAALTAPPPAARLPAAYVMPVGSRPGANAVMGAVRQRVQETIAVILMAQNLRDAQGAAATMDVVELYTRTRGLLVGWTPDPAWEQLVLGPARLLGFSGGIVTWQETYSSAYLQRGTMEARHA